MRQNAGNSNNGNTSRRFFAKPEVTAEILRLDEDLIRRFGTVLNALNCNRPIDPAKFSEFCYDTAELYVALYWWYPTTNTVHKILVHGSCIISSISEVPQGALSEKAQKAQNKVYKRNRLHHSRKFSREASNTDVMNMMLACSDPYINKFRRPPKRSDTERDSMVSSLLKNTEDDCNDTDSE